jgi:cell division protein FtsW
VLLVAIVAVLNVIGIVMVLSASSVSSLTDYGSPWYFFFRQLLWTVAGVAAFAFAIRFDYHRWQRLVKPLLVLSAVLLLLVLVPGIGIHVSGARRWIGYGIFRIQPSEIAKLALLVFTADIVSRRARELADWKRVLRPVVLALLLFTALVMKEPDLGTTLVMSFLVVAMLVAGGIRAKHLVVVGTLGVVAVTALAWLEPYRRERMLTFLHPFADSSNSGYQIAQSLIAIGSGGVTGVGLGASRAKWNFLPNAHTDFIFAIIGEELGLIGAFVVMALFVGFGILGIRAALRAPDRFGTLLAAGATMWVVAQAAINIGAVVGVLPVTGIPLPYVSFGGSALITTMLASGILVNVAKQGPRPGRASGRASGRAPTRASQRAR